MQGRKVTTRDEWGERLASAYSREAAAPAHPHRGLRTPSQTAPSQQADTAAATPTTTSADTPTPPGRLKPLSPKYHHNITRHHHPHNRAQRGILWSTRGHVLPPSLPLARSQPPSKRPRRTPRRSARRLMFPSLPTRLSLRQGRDPHSHSYPHQVPHPNCLRPQMSGGGSTRLRERRHRKHQRRSRRPRMWAQRSTSNCPQGGPQINKLGMALSETP
jgi:hypothetical protein